MQHYNLFISSIILHWGLWWYYWTLSSSFLHAITHGNCSLLFIEILPGFLSSFKILRNLYTSIQVWHLNFPSAAFAVLLAFRRILQLQVLCGFSELLLSHQTQNMTGISIVYFQNLFPNWKLYRSSITVITDQVIPWNRVHFTKRLLNQFQFSERRDLFQCSSIHLISFFHLLQGLPSSFFLTASSQWYLECWKWYTQRVFIRGSRYSICKHVRT
jgi:hypothetical protein